MPKVAQQTMTSIWTPPDDGLFNAAEVFQLGQAGLGDITLPGPGARTTFYGTSPFGQPVPLGAERAAPAQPATTIENYITMYRDLIQKMRDLGQCRYVQMRVHDCMAINHPNGWQWMVHLRGQVGDGTISAPTSREFADARIGQSHPFTADYHVVLIKQKLTLLTTTETVAANGVVFLSDPEPCDDCGGGYPGPDQIGYIACDADTGVSANLLYTTNGGGSWTTGTSADPFGSNEHADFPLVHRKDDDEFRLVVARITTDGSNAAEIAYADVTFGAEGTTSWTTVDVGSNNGDIITAMFWPKWGRMYAATDNNTIHVSTDQGATWTTAHTASNPVRAFARDAVTGNVYTAGDSNELLVEKGDSGTFESLTGPTGSNNSSAIAVARDGTIWLGNGTSIFYTTNKLPSATGQWTSSKDFGSNHGVETIDLKAQNHAAKQSGGDSQLVWVVVNDSSAGEGDVWYTVDGGGLWTEVDNLSNNGYNAGYFSPADPNWAIVVGEIDTTARIHKLSPVSGV